jgi:hypothetical protein
MAPAIILQSGMNLCLTGQPQNLQQPKDPRVICSAIIYYHLFKCRQCPLLDSWGTHIAPEAHEQFVKLHAAYEDGPIFWAKGLCVLKL